MATNFPSSLDAYSYKSYRSPISFENWNGVQDAVEALEAKVGVDDSANADSLDYRVGDLLIPSAPSIDPDDYQEKIGSNMIRISYYNSSKVYVRVYNPNSTSFSTYGPYGYQNVSDTYITFSDNTLTLKKTISRLAGTPNQCLIAYIVAARNDSFSDPSDGSMDHFMGVDVKGEVDENNSIVLTFGGDGTALSDTLVGSICDVTYGRIYIKVLYSYT